MCIVHGGVILIRGKCFSLKESFAGWTGNIWPNCCGDFLIIELAENVRLTLWSKCCISFTVISQLENICLQQTLLLLKAEAGIAQLIVCVLFIPIEMCRAVDY